MMENLGTLSSKLFFLIMAPLREAREGVYNTVCLVLMIIDLKMILRELLGPTDLARAQTLRVHKPTEVVMIG